MSRSHVPTDFFSLDDKPNESIDETESGELSMDAARTISMYGSIFQQSNADMYVPRDDSPVDTMLIASQHVPSFADEFSMEPCYDNSLFYTIPTTPLMPVKTAACETRKLDTFVDTTLSKFPFPELALYSHSTISFCLFRWYYLWDVPAAALKPHMNESWNPCSNPVTLDEINAPILRSYPYVVSTKSNGVRVQVMIIEHPGTHSPMVLMIDRNTIFYDVGQSLVGHYVNSLARGTLLDGELVERTDGKWAFILFDVVAYDNKSVRRVPSLQERLEKVWDVYNDLPIAYMPNGVMFVWMTKSMFSTKDPLAIEKSLAEERPYATDGLVLTPLLFGIPFETSPFLFKWKPDELYSIDFRLVGHAPSESRNKWGLELKYKYYGKERNLLQGFWFIGYMFKLGSVKINSSDALQEILSLWQSDSRGPCNGKRYCIVECRLDKLDLEGEVMEWSVVRERTDKSEPNSEITLLGTLKTIMFPLSMAGLKEALYQSV